MNYYIRYWSQDTQESGRWLVLPYQFTNKENALRAADKMISKLSVKRPLVVSQDDLTPTELEEWK